MYDDVSHYLTKNDTGANQLVILSNLSNQFLLIISVGDIIVNMYFSN